MVDIQGRQKVAPVLPCTLTFHHIRFLDTFTAGNLSSRKTILGSFIFGHITLGLDIQNMACRASCQKAGEEVGRFDESCLSGMRHNSKR